MHAGRQYAAVECHASAYDAARYWQKLRRWGDAGLLAAAERYECKADSLRCTAVCAPLVDARSPSLFCRLMPRRIRAGRCLRLGLGAGRRSGRGPGAFRTLRTGITLTASRGHSSRHKPRLLAAVSGTGHGREARERHGGHLAPEALLGQEEAEAGSETYVWIRCVLRSADATRVDPLESERRERRVRRPRHVLWLRSGWFRTAHHDSICLHKRCVPRASRRPRPSPPSCISARGPT